MANSAVIGALRVVLGADSASFDKVIKKSQGTLAGFSKSMGFSAAAIATAVTGMAVAIGIGLKSTIDTFDEMNDAAKKTGVAVEALSQLKYAAEQSGLSFEQLSGALVKLSKNTYAALTNATGKQAEAFHQLGISLDELQGKSPDQVLLMLSDAFKQLAPGVRKTALELTLFGKTGADLAPLLAEGSAGIRNLMEQADKLGLTMSGKAAKAADDFNDSLNTLHRAWTGLWVTLANQVLPVFADIAKQFAAWVTNSGAMARLGAQLGSALKGVAEIVLNLANNFQLMATGANAAYLSLKAVFQALTFQWVAAAQNASAAFDETKKYFELTKQFQSEMAAYRRLAAVSRGPGTSASIQGETQDTETLAAAKDKATDAQKALNKATDEYASYVEKTRTPLEAYQIELAKISALQKTGVGDAETYARAQFMAAAQVANQYGELAATVGGALTTMFGENKNVAIAVAIINTLQGVTAVLAQYGGTPFGWAMAAATAAAGFAQVAKIKSTTVSSKSGSASLGGGTGRGAPSMGGGVHRAAGGGGAGHGPDRAIAISLTGSGRYSRQEVRGLIEQIIEAQGDGAKLVLAGS